MAFSILKVLKGLLVQEEGTLNPKKILITPGGTANTTTTITGSQSVDRTITLPDATDTLVGKATTDVLTNKSIDADTNIITNIENADIKTGAAIDATKIATGSVDNTEFGYLDGVTSSIQAQLDSKAPGTGTVTLTGVQTLSNKSLVDNSTSIVDFTDATKRMLFDAAGTTATSTTVRSSQTVDRILTLPDATDTLVGKATTDVLTNKTLTSPVINSPTGIVKGDVGLGNVDNTSDATKNAAVATLTNKSLVDSSTAIVDVVDNTKQILFNAGGTTATSTTVTAAQTANRVVTLPDATDTLVGKATTDTLTNKTFGDAPIFTQIATPSTPAAGLNKIYPKADGNFYNLNSSGIETPIGSGSGGVKNYLGTVNNVNGNGNFELGNASKWSLFNTTLTNKIPTGTVAAGAASITTFNTVSSGQLAGSYSLQVASSGALTAGQGFISDAFTIDLEDQAKVLTFGVNYSVISGLANLNLSGSSANTFAIYVYDVTNAVWIQPSNVYGMIQGTGVGNAVGQFQTSSNSTQYRLAVVVITASAGASTLYFDDMSVAPSAYVAGSPVTDWQSYSPTFVAFGTVSPASVAMQWRRVGANIEIRGNFTVGVPTNAIASFTLPNSFLTLNSGVSGYYARSATSTAKGGPIQHNPSSNTLNFSAADVYGTASVSSTAAAIGTSVATTGDGIFLANISIPIQGWSSSIQMSDSADTRVVDFVGGKVNGQAVTSNVTNYTFTSIKDSHNAFNGTDTYVVPVAGDYMVSLTCVSTAAGTYSGVFINGVQSNYVCAIQVVNARGTGTAIIPNLKAGDLLTIRSVGTSATINGSVVDTLSISRISGPVAIAATETIAARYTNSAGTTVGTSFTLIPYANKVYDTHGAYNTSTGIFTAPVSGKYRVSAKYLSNANAQNQYIDLRKNGSTYSQTFTNIASGTITTSMVVVDTVDMVAGDTISIFGQSSASITLNTTAFYNILSIEKIGL